MAEATVDGRVLGGGAPPLVVVPEAPATRRMPVAGPSITAVEHAAVADAVQHAWYGRAGSYVQRFERAFAELHGVRQAIALPSCTSAIHLACAAWGLGPGDEVLVPELTWIASAAPAVQLGAEVGFVDVDPRTWCLDVDALARRIGPRTRVVVAVDLYGNLPDYARLRQLCRERNVHLLEDAAEAIGTTCGAQRAGTFGDVGVFSFHGSKTLTTGEGGMLLTDDDALAARVRVLQDHGRTPGDRSFACDEVAFKYKMTDLQAALGLAQLGRLDELVGTKRALFDGYRRLLADVPGLAWNDPGPGVDACPWMTTIVLHDRPASERTRLQEALAAAGIDSRPFFPPLGSTPAFAGRPGSRRADGWNPHAAHLGPRGLNLPSALSLAPEDLERVAAVVRATLRR
ncbi:MAG: DegT/DnrJ/EryC1/StrS family aminotransferase [Planctomycetes bacterium]|nr:DegT/DnrJ/EryC1/StrS family aminotransferase [Planctomycetota bacterium]